MLTEPLKARVIEKSSGGFISRTRIQKRRGGLGKLGILTVLVGADDSKRECVNAQPHAEPRVGCQVILVSP